MIHDSLEYLNQKRKAVADYARSIAHYANELVSAHTPQGMWAHGEASADVKQAHDAIAASDPSAAVEAEAKARAAYETKRAARLAELERELAPERQAWRAAAQAATDAVAAAHAVLNAFPFRLRRGAQSYMTNLRDTTDLAKHAPYLSDYVPGGRNSSTAAAAGNAVYQSAVTEPGEFVFHVSGEAEAIDTLVANTRERGGLTSAEAEALAQACREIFAERWRIFAERNGIPAGEPETKATAAE